MKQWLHYQEGKSWNCSTTCRISSQAHKEINLSSQNFKNYIREDADFCLWDAQNTYGKYLCQGHHVNWLSRGGEDSLKNMILVCSNHHTAIHRCDAQFDYGNSSFDFGTRREQLGIDHHFLK